MHAAPSCGVGGWCRCHGGSGRGGGGKAKNLAKGFFGVLERLVGLTITLHTWFFWIRAVNFALREIGGCGLGKCCSIDFVLVCICVSVVRIGAVVAVQPRGSLITPEAHPTGSGSNSRIVDSVPIDACSPPCVTIGCVTV